MDKIEIEKWREKLSELESRYKSDDLNIDELLELSIHTYYFDPSGDTAIPIYEEILRKDQNNETAKIWLIYIKAFHSLADDWDKELIKMSEDLILSNNEEISAAGFYLKATVTNVMRKLPKYSKEQIELLKKSVELAPSWADNRYSLSRELMEVGHLKEALVQGKRARDNICEEVPKELSDRLFQGTITGKYNPGLSQEGFHRNIREIEKLLRTKPKKRPKKYWFKEL